MANLLKSLPKLKIVPKFYRILPETAGIYVFFKDNLPIYIGKAINLKRRVSSYFDTVKYGKEKSKLSDNEWNNLIYEKIIKMKEKEMNKVVKELDFETAAILRDEIIVLRDKLTKS